MHEVALFLIKINMSTALQPLGGSVLAGGGGGGGDGVGAGGVGGGGCGRGGGLGGGRPPPPNIPHPAAPLEHMKED